MEFRPCIDIHNGKVKQIVGGSLLDEGNRAKENFVAEQDAAFFAKLYREQGLKGGHIILLNPVGSEYYEATKAQAELALQAYPGGFQIGGGITAARKYIMPSLLKELRGKMHTIQGEELNRVQMQVYDLDNEEEFREFAKGAQRPLKVYGTDRYVAYDPQKRIGVMISKLGASQAISVGAYAFALSQLDAQKQ